MKSVALSVACLLGLTPTTAGANVYEVFGAGARAESMVGAMTATADDAGAVWHNPAGLSLARPSFSFGLTGAFDRTAILLAARPQGYDPPNYTLRLENRRDSAGQGPLLGVNIGLTLRLFSDALHFGAMLYFPSVGFAHTQGYFADERQQYFDNRLRFERLEERLRGEVIAAGVSYRLEEWLALGVGLKVQQSNRNRTQVYTPNAADPSNVYMNIQLEQETQTALIAGALVQPWDFLRFGLTVHDELAFDVRGQSEVQIAGQENVDPYPVTQRIALTEHGSVPRFQLGAAFLTPRWTVSVDGSLDIWSRYRDAQGLLAGFDDSYTVAAAFDYLVRTGTRFRGGIAWHPSPVPAQSGRTNFVDNDRIVVGLGAGNEFTFFERTFQLDLGLQAHALLSRSETKSVPASPRTCDTGTTSVCDELPDRAEDTPLFSAAETRGLQTGNPGFPGYSSGGYMLVAGVDMRWLF